MQFNQGFFNRSFFNRTASTTVAALVGSASWLYSVSASQMRTNVLLSGQTGITYGAAATLVKDAFFPASSLGWSFGVLGQIRADLHLYGETGIGFAVAGQVSSANTESFTLSNLGLLPGQTVTINSDTLEIFVNGVPRVDAWRNGGEFIKITPGENALQVLTDGIPKGVLSVQWQDRWW